MRDSTPRVLTGLGVLFPAIAGGAPLAAQECNLPPTKVSMQLAFRPGTATQALQAQGLALDPIYTVDDLRR